MKLLLLSLTILAVSAFLALLSSGRPRLATLIGSAGTVTGGLAACLPALYCLGGGTSLLYSAPWGVPGGHFVLNLDPLAAFFLLPITLLAAACGIYATGYLKGHHPEELGKHWFLFNLLLAALILVVTAANALLFLAAWEIMTLASFFLVAFEHQKAEVRKAAWLYLVLAHLALMLLLALFIVCGVQCAGFDFADFTSLARLPVAEATLLFTAAIAGFGVKAGLFPLHVWLPDAHPAAPSHVSALMSGVLVKTGIYGILRFYTLLPSVSGSAGIVLMALGGTGALFGITLACFQSDIKRALAYSTVENIGIIFVGLGLGLYAAANDQPALAVLGFAGGLLHIWNHSLFKGLMFLGAGSVLHATKTRDMDRLGGLLQRIPWTGGLLIGGSLAIAALPPFNGLISEYLIYLGLLQSGTSTAGFAGLLPLLMVGLLGLTGALAVVAFTRLTGITLLGQPRSTAAETAHESSALMLAPMVLLLTVCLAIGLFPRFAVELLAPALAQLLPAGTTGVSGILVPVATLGRWGLLLCLFLGILALVLAGLRRRRPTARRATWGCAFPFPSSRMAYTGEAFSELTVNHLLPEGLRPEVTAEKPFGLFPVASRLSQRTLDPVLTKVFLPVVETIALRCQRLRWLQQGKSHIYLLYIFLCCTFLMVWVMLEGRS
jgi:formate hydrogenlyase subunit 3/multisubunit Na+/H+ antiporter MnhD subunit